MACSLVAIFLCNSFRCPPVLWHAQVPGSDPMPHKFPSAIYCSERELCAPLSFGFFDTSHSSVGTCFVCWLHATYTPLNGLIKWLILSRFFHIVVWSLTVSGELGFLTFPGTLDWIFIIILYLIKYILYFYNLFNLSLDPKNIFGMHQNIPDLNKFIPICLFYKARTIRWFEVK